MGQLLIPSKPATFTTHYSLLQQKGNARDERHDTTALLTADGSPIPLSPFDPNEHRNIIATETTTSFIGKGKKGRANEQATFQRGKSPTNRQLGFLAFLSGLLDIFLDGFEEKFLEGFMFLVALSLAATARAGPMRALC